MRKFSFSGFIFIFSLFLTNLFQAQSIKQDKLVFGKNYTMNELKDLNGVIRCASTSYEQYLQQTDPNRMTEAQFEAWITPLINNAKADKSNAGGIVTIPVVVHVIHSGQPVGVAPNITTSQVQSQITVMNNDFRRAAGTPGFNASPIGADTMIQFALAKVDPNGNPTDGVNRVNLCKAFYTTGEVNSIIKPQTIWNPQMYMNMWSVNLGGASANILGYAQFPSNSGLGGLNTNGGAASTDGVVARFSTFGSSDYNDGTFLLSAPYDKGRTMTHEVGHYLGLRHIWGDATCGNDFCADTPTAHTANYNCNKAIASCTDPSVFEMVENYMDYTNDTCMNIFTLDQKARITAVMNNSPRRMELKNSTADLAIPLFANDAEVKLENICGATVDVTCTPTSSVLSFILYNRGTSNLTSAVVTYTVGGVIQTYNYTGNLIPNQNAVIVVPLAASLPSGTMMVAVTNVNGVVDQRISNNSFSFPHTSGTAPVAGNGNYTFTLQNDYYGSETNWELRNSAGVVLYSGGNYPDVPNPTTSTPLPAPIVLTFALSNDCYTLVMYDSYGDGIYVDGGYYNLKNAAGAIVLEGSDFGFQQLRAIRTSVLATAETQLNTSSIYPNPVSDVLNITKVSDRAIYEIYSVVGQVVSKGNVKNGKVNVSPLTQGNYIIKISDKDTVQNFKFIKK